MDSNTDQPVPADSRKTPAFWQSKSRRPLFLIGIVIAVIGAGYMAYSTYILASWKEARIVSMVADPNGTCGRNQGQRYRYAYMIDGKEYAGSMCGLTPPTVKTVTYNPANPSSYVINTPIVNVVIGGIGLALGLAFALGALFLRDARPGELGYTSDNTIPPRSR